MENNFNDKKLDVMKLTLKLNEKLKKKKKMTEGRHGPGYMR